MGVDTETFSVEREVLIDARPDTVWEMLVDEKEAIRWMGLAAAFDLRCGGRYRVEVVPGQIACGEFVEIDPPNRLVYTWGWESERIGVPPGSTTVVLELVPRGNATLLRLTHGNLPSTGSAESHAHGWTHYLDRLSVLATGGDPGRDPWIDGPAR